VTAAGTPMTSDEYLEKQVAIGPRRD
jgi:hypothetical protein